MRFSDESLQKVYCWFWAFHVDRKNSTFNIYNSKCKVGVGFQLPGFAQMLNLGQVKGKERQAKLSYTKRGIEIVIGPIDGPTNRDAF